MNEPANVELNRFERSAVQSAGDSVEPLSAHGVNEFMHIEHVKSLKFTRVEEAPSAVGLYAWYGKLGIPVADYKSQIDAQGRDVGEIRFRRLLAKHLERYELPPFPLSGRGTFGAQWSGCLDDQSGPIVQTAVLSGELTEGMNPYVRRFAEALDVVAEKESYRQALLQLLDNAFPVISAPIYIGVAEDLRVRLREHVSRYKQLRDAIDGEDDKFDRLRRHVEKTGGEFADRAIVRGFQPDHLMVTVLPIDTVAGSEVPKPTRRRIAEAGEWLLNHWCRPFAGRR